MTGTRDGGRGTGGVEEAADAVRRELGSFAPRVAIVLGSGLGVVADAVREPRRVPYAKIPGFPAPGVPGHQGELVAGSVAGVPVLVRPSTRPPTRISTVPPVKSLVALGVTVAPVLPWPSARIQVATGLTLSEPRK